MTTISILATERGAYHRARDEAAAALAKRAGTDAPVFRTGKALSPEATTAEAQADAFALQMIAALAEEVDALRAELAEMRAAASAPATVKKGTKS